jgi:hypothetical protein
MNRFWKTVLLTSLFVGITDLILAYSMQFAKTGKFADKMLYYMAGGALGLETSMQGGFWIGLLGLAFHFFIAFSFTLLVFILFPKLKMQSLNIYWLLAVGMLYAPFVNCFMRYIVLPLTRLPGQKPLDIQKELIGWIIFGIVFGIPIFLSASGYYKRIQIR